MAKQDPSLFHKGEVRCIISEKVQERKFLFTGGADMAIKLWDNTNPNKTIVVQTLIGSGGMVKLLV